MSNDSLITGKQPDFSRPVLFLDFDDVLNVFGEAGALAAAGFQTVETTLPDGRPASITYSPEIVDAVRNMNAVWLTSWKAATQDILNPLLGFDFGYVDWRYRGFSDSGCHGKAEAVCQVMSGKGVPFAVTDDSMYGGWEESFRHGVPESDVLVIAPEWGVGLTMDDVRRLKAFLS